MDRANIVKSGNAFMMWQDKEKEQVMEAVDADMGVLEADVDEPTKFSVETIGDGDYCISFK